ncbi:hypothetical protein SAMN03097699_2333 [Flavobacteriaceae bacterium MAR_2010_188]|nr:hypothetical protein SAMN03097699_2333 [Flavobacteriaceae bacterium MAR_2010_188]
MVFHQTFIVLYFSGFKLEVIKNPEMVITEQKVCSGFGLASK